MRFHFSTFLFLSLSHSFSLSFYPSLSLLPLFLTLSISLSLLLLFLSFFLSPLSILPIFHYIQLSLLPLLLLCITLFISNSCTPSLFLSLIHHPCFLVVTLIAFEIKSLFFINTTLMIHWSTVQYACASVNWILSNSVEREKNRSIFEDVLLFSVLIIFLKNFN